MTLDPSVPLPIPPEEAAAAAVLPPAPEEPRTVPAADEPIPEGGYPTLDSRDELLAIDDAVYEPVDVREWRRRVWVRNLTATERDAFDAESAAFMREVGTGEGMDAARERAALTNFRSRRVARALVAGPGKPERIMRDRDVIALGQKNASAIDAIDDVVTRLSGMDDKAVERAIARLKGTPPPASGID